MRHQAIILGHVPCLYVPVEDKAHTLFPSSCLHVSARLSLIVFSGAPCCILFARLPCVCVCVRVCVCVCVIVAFVCL